MNGNTAYGPDYFSEEYTDWCAEQVEIQERASLLAAEAIRLSRKVQAARGSSADV